MSSSERLKLRVRKLADHADLPLPRAASTGAAGIDLAAAVDEPREIAPGGRALVGCGVAVEIPPGWEGQVRPRSGLAVRHGVTVLNTPGTIDSDYRGEVAVVLVNLGDAPFTIARGDRIAQLVVAPTAPTLEIEEVGELSATERGAGGFGSTGR